MSRVKLMSAMAFDLVSYEESMVADPVIRVTGELPAGSEPFGINRVYKGPQGRYEEVLAVADPDGRIIWETEPRLIELRGMMFEDLFRREVRDRLEITTPGEHAVLFYLDGQLTGRIPVFIDAPGSAKTAGVVLDAAEVALKKGSICWLTIDQPGGGVATRPAWYVQQGSKLFVVKGGSEQELPNLEHVKTVTISVKSKEQKAALGELTADVRVVESGSDEFERIAGLGVGTRLNLPDGEGALDRWKAECTIVELAPRG
ncbi:hypothetical protein [Nitriliruptor alkaliphilus]|uniref:hypothetical protein n=1 Tax=Nitriliruptor alkaliphilus TaxID=427918 RepID=UPI0006991544|nr:hypothetical protein [Nitriliruptor alkaliphilus]